MSSCWPTITLPTSASRPETMANALSVDVSAGIVAQERLRAVRLPERDRHLLVRSDADAVHAAVLFAERGERGIQLGAVILAVGDEHEQLARLAVVLLRDLARAAQRGAE